MHADTTTTTTVRPARQPRIFFGWYLVSACMMIHFTISVVFVYGFQAFVNPLADTFGWSKTAITGANSLQRLEGGIVSPIAGFLLDRIGTQKMVMGGMFLVGGGMVLMSQMQELWHYYLCFLFISIGFSGGMGGSFAAAAVNWFKRKRGRAMAFLWMGAVPSGLFVPFIVVLIEQVGWRTAMLVLGLTIWAVCVPLGYLIRHRPEPYGYLPDGDDPTAAQATANAAAAAAGGAATGATGNAPLAAAPLTGATVRETLRTPAFWNLALLFGVQNMATSGVFAVQVPYFQSIGFSAALAGSTVGVFTMLSAIGRMGGGFAMDYFDKRFVLMGLILSQAAGLATLLLVPGPDGYWLVFPFGLFFGMAFGGMLPARALLLSEYFGTKNFGAIQGISQTTSVIGGILGPVAMGLSVDITGSYHPAITGIAIVSTIIAPAALLLAKPKSTYGT